MLLDMNRPEQALVEYEAELEISPNRFNSLYGARLNWRSVEKEVESNRRAGY